MQIMLFACGVATTLCHLLASVSDQFSYDQAAITVPASYSCTSYQMLSKVLWSLLLN